MGFGWEHERSAASVGEWAERFLLRIVDAATAGCIFAVPVLFGGRSAWGHVLLIALAATMTVAWCLRQALRGGRLEFSGAEWILLGGSAWVLIQMMPLPADWWAVFTPQAHRILTLWTSDSDAPIRLGLWNRLTLTPTETRIDWILFTAYSLIFWVTYQRVRRREDIERIFRWLAYAAIGASVFALIQYFAGNGKYFWFYQHPYAKLDDAVKGWFTSRNHFAHFLALAAGPLVWWALEAKRHARERRVSSDFGPPNAFHLGYAGRTIVVGIVAFACLLTLSRGGIAVFLAALAIVLSAAYRTRRIEGRFLIAFLIVAGLIGIALGIYGYAELTGRFESVATLSWEKIDRYGTRTTVWKNTLAAIADFGGTGSGAGSFRHVYELYRPWRPSNHFQTHAENGYLQIALELGLPGVCLLAATVFLLGRAIWAIRGARLDSGARLAGAILTAVVVVSLLHSLADFVWYVPALAAVTAILIACLFRLANNAARRERNDGSARAQTQERKLSAVAWGSVAGTIAVLGAVLVSDRLGPARAESHWHRYLVLCRSHAFDDAELEALLAPDSNGPVAGDSGSGETKNDGDADNKDEDTAAPEAVPETPQQRRRAVIAYQERLIRELEEVVRLDPAHSQAHAALARMYLRVFMLAQVDAPNPMPVDQICDAVMQSQFGSQEELEVWLKRAIGENVRYLKPAFAEALAAVRVCPLQGIAYMTLADTCFLRGATPAIKRALVDQAVSVKPYDADVLMQAAEEAAVAGDLDRCLEMWRRAYRADRPARFLLVDRFVKTADMAGPAAQAQVFLSEFQPDLEITRYMYRQYRERFEPEEYRPLLEYFLEKLVAAIEKAPRSEAADLLIDAHYVLLELNRPEEALQYAYRALELDPGSYRVRRYLAQCLEKNGKYEEAEKQLRWLVQRQPGHQGLRRELLEIREKRMKAELERAARLDAPIPR